jgi:hypothetical protein
MKKCSYCGLEYPDEANQCAVCHTSLETPSSLAPEAGLVEHVISPEEKRFWEKMTFRQLALVLTRLQALFFFFYATLDVTYLPGYLRGTTGYKSYTPLYLQVSLTQYLALLRIVMNVCMGLALALWSERILSWLVKDLVSPLPADSPTPAVTPSPRSSQS